jgi:hypothetical protein
MKHPLLYLLFSIFGSTAGAQYYYKDVLGIRQVNDINKAMKKARVLSVQIKNYNFDDSEIDDFLCEQTTDNNCKYVFTVTGSPYTGENRLYSWFNNQSQITRSVDSNISTTIQNYYQYDAGGNLSNLTVTSFENGSRDKVTETHQWFYTNNRPEKMLLVKTGSDTITVVFQPDENGNVGIENVYRKGRVKETVYYYYDSQKRLTDIVKYSYIAKKLLPETIFEYNESGQLFKRTDFTPGKSDYQNWLFKYDANGLKTEEHCYLKGNMFRGKLVYKYEIEKE